MKGSVLVTGGAGYIGSHVALALIEAGWRVVVADTLVTGRRDLVPSAATFIRADVGDGVLMRDLMKRHRCRAVLHFAGSTVVPESVSDPLAYWRNNTAAARTLIEAAVQAGISAFVFSSTAAVYGEPDTLPVTEDAPARPLSPYGRSKLVTEWVLEDVGRATGLRHVALRYFNVAGADPLGRTGQSTPNATHLIKVACEVACGRRDRLTIFGEDYDTPDGTCIRDFIHVSDLAQAHVAALDHLMAGGQSLTLNAGYGWGISVRQVIDTVGRLAGRPLPVTAGPRRQGDIARMVAETSRIRQALNWHPCHDSLDEIMGSALAWERRLSPPPRPGVTVPVGRLYVPVATPAPPRPWAG